MFRLHKAATTTNQKMKMKYWLIDFVITLSIVAAILSAHHSFGSFFDNIRGANGHCVNHEDRTAATPKPEPTTFHVGDIIEVYEPKIHPAYAFLAKIEHVSQNSEDGGSVQYDVRLGFSDATGGDIQKKIHASAIRRMEPFEEKTHAMCDDGKILNSKLIPCTVDFHVPNSMRIFEGGAQQQEQQYPWLYSVSFQQDGEWRKKIMPVSRIRRIVRQDTSGSSKKCDEPSCGNVSSPRSRSTQENSQIKTLTTTPLVSNEEEDSSTFPIGSIIEIHGPGGIFAFPATVTGVNQEKKAKKYQYNLTHGITHASMKNVDMQFVHPYQVYDKGTTASCNVGKLRKIIMVPCTVISHVEDNDRGGDIVYQVEAKMLDAEKHMLFLPRMRVQRFFTDRRSEGR